MEENAKKINFQGNISQMNMQVNKMFVLSNNYCYKCNKSFSTILFKKA